MTILHDDSRSSVRLISRRDVLRLTSYGLLGAGFTSATGCNWGAAERSFYMENVFKWEPEEVLSDLAFAIVPGPDKFALDYLDLDCPHCGVAFRAFLYGVELGYQFAITCPVCPPSLRISIVVSRFLLKELLAYGMRRAVAFAIGNGYNVHKVGPIKTKHGTVGVDRSAACYTVTNREPRDIFNREIPAVPDRLYYFTEVNGARSDLLVYHCWTRNGRLTDRIPLEVGSSRWRTWSMKENLAPGVWIVTAETSNGAVLDVREFHIT